MQQCPNEREGLRFAHRVISQVTGLSHHWADRVWVLLLATGDNQGGKIACRRRCHLLRLGGQRALNPVPSSRTAQPWSLRKLSARAVELRLHRRGPAVAQDPRLRIPGRLFAGPRLPRPATRYHRRPGPPAGTPEAQESPGLDHDPPPRAWPPPVTVGATGPLVLRWTGDNTH